MRRNLPRYCKECGISVPKGKQYCSEHRLESKRKWNRLHRKLITGFTKNEENEFLKQCVQNKIDTTGRIKREYQRLGKKIRSTPWLIKRLKHLGIYKTPDIKTSNHFLFEDIWKKREEKIKEWNYSIVKNSSNATKIRVKCNKCNNETEWHTIKRYTNGQCPICKRIEKKLVKKDIDNKKILERNKKYTDRIELIKKFIQNDTDVKKYSCWKETPISKEYKWYKGNNSIRYRDAELTYKLDSISYYIYGQGSTVCPDKPAEGNKICYKCKEEKPVSEFWGKGFKNSCKQCAKNYRKEFLLEGEIKRNRERYYNDPIFKLNLLIRSYVYGALKGRLKTRRTKEILGIEWYEFRQYIEERFEHWMNWNNHGNGKDRWALQHIVPRDLAINEKEIYLLNYHKNLIPMCSIQNGILKNRIAKEQLNEWHINNKDIQRILKRNKHKVVNLAADSLNSKANKKSLNKNKTNTE